MDFEEACKILDDERHFQGYAYTYLGIMGCILALLCIFYPDPALMLPACVNFIVAGLLLILSERKRSDILHRMSEKEWDLPG